MRLGLRRLVIDRIFRLSIMRLGLALLTALMSLIELDKMLSRSRNGMGTPCEFMMLLACSPYQNYYFYTIYIKLTTFINQLI